MKHYISGDVAVLEAGRMLVGNDEDAFLFETVGVRLGQGYRKILIDLSEVTTTNSTGRGSLVQVHKLTVAKGARLVFCGLDYHLHHIFDVTHLSQVLTIAKDRAQALSLLHAHSTG